MRQSLFGLAAQHSVDDPRLPQGYPATLRIPNFGRSVLGSIEAESLNQMVIFNLSALLEIRASEVYKISKNFLRPRWF